MNSSTKKRWVVAVTGASGIQYALTLMAAMSKAQVELHVVFSDAAIRVLKDEVGIKTSQSQLRAALSDLDIGPNLITYNPRDIGAEPASGTALFDGMVICPCSMGTLGSIVAGVSQNLVHRAADVTMKEKRPLIIVPRETPLSAIHLRNMLAMAELGAVVLPAMPGFYTQPKQVQDIVDSLVLKILDQVGVPHEIAPRWQGVGLGSYDSYSVS